jgi:hypothetical protein
MNKYMAGGLLNLTAIGNANVILTGNPTKTFFKVTYSKYTNFGLQKFRIDYNGMRDLRLTEPSSFSFKIPRNGDLLMDTYLSVTLPDIWSPVYHPCAETSNTWVPYSFRWIRDLGTHMIKEVTITCGSQILQKYSGEYLAAMVNRDFKEDKKKLFNEMSGNTDEFNNLANAYGRANTYPSAFYMDSNISAEPSFRSRTILVPINTWFTMDSRCAFPLIALQYNDLYINFTIRPIQELFQVRDVFDATNLFPYMQPDFNLPQFQMYRFLQPPPAVNISPENYANKSINSWNADIHLVSTYCFLSDEERRTIALENQVYLVKDVFEYKFENVVGTRKLELTSNGLIANWMWYFQRNDVFMRNEWSNYTNWPYTAIPSDIQLAPAASIDPIFPQGPLTNPPIGDQEIGSNTGIYVTGLATTENIRNIMVSMGIVLNGDYRENVLPEGVYNYIEKWTRTAGSGKNGLYCYNFCLNTDPFEYQPSGAMNLTKFKTIELEINTITPVADPVNSFFDIICDVDGNPIGVNKQSWKMYDYTYNMTLFEERYNILSFIGGNCGMLYAR